MKKLKIYQIDAFTNRVFSGNYAAVIILDEWLSDSLMQSIATENNLSETAFAKQISSSSYEIRWFSPMAEIDFCGHATLATAFVLFSKNNTMEELIFTASAVGMLKISKMPNEYIKMTFPNQKPSIVNEIPQDLLDGLSISPIEVLRNRQAYFALYNSEEDIFNMETKSDKLKKLAPYDTVVTAKSNKYDFVSRYFWPANGGYEDPVTGSIHTGLAPLWSDRLGKNTLTAYQASQRGGILKCEVTDESVIIFGQAILYLEGEITIPNEAKI